MPEILPIRDLKNTSEISKKVKASKEPIFITKNGYGDMVIMSMELYEKTIAKMQVTSLITDGLDDLKDKEPTDGKTFFDAMRSKYGRKI